MSAFLRDEARWASEQSVRAQTELDRMADPKWRADEQRRRERALAATESDLWAARREVEKVSDDEQWQAEMDHKRREVSDWKQMAQAASDRLVATEQDGLFEGVDS